MRHRYTTKDDNTIINCIRKYPNNLTKAFKVAAIKIGVTDRAIMSRYYRVLRYEKLIFSVVTNKKAMANTKNARAFNSVAKDLNKTTIGNIIVTPWILLKNLFKK